MKTASEMVKEIRRREKHAGHSGGLDGCPLCNPKNASSSVIDDVLSFGEPTPKESAPADPTTARLKNIFGDE